MKANHFVRPLGRAPKPATQQQITALAHELWIAHGCPTGRDLDIWLDAERQLSGGIFPRPPQAAQPLHRDPIPADPEHPTADEDPALGEARKFGAPPRRSPTSL